LLLGRRESHSSCIGGIHTRRIHFSFFNINALMRLYCFFSGAFTPAYLTSVV
jgi:hypothetical protein